MKVKQGRFIRIYRFIFCQNYMMLQLVTPPPFHLRQCITLVAVSEGLLLLDIGWFVFFLNKCGNARYFTNVWLIVLTAYWVTYSVIIADWWRPNTGNVPYTTFFSCHLYINKMTHAKLVPVPHLKSNMNSLIYGRFHLVVTLGPAEQARCRLNCVIWTLTPTLVLLAQDHELLW